MKLMPSLGNRDPGEHLQLGLNCPPKPSDEGQFVTSMVRVVNVGSWCITGGLYWMRCMIFLVVSLEDVLPESCWKCFVDCQDVLCIWPRSVLYYLLIINLSCQKS